MAEEVEGFRFRELSYTGEEKQRERRVRELGLALFNFELGLVRKPHESNWARFEFEIELISNRTGLN